MKSINTDYFPILTFILGLIIWVIDAAVDVFIIHNNQDESFLENVFFAHGDELWMRTLIVLILVAVGFYARFIIHRQKLVEDELLKHKNNLKDLVEIRMGEFYKKNLELKREIENHKLTEKELERLATTDPLTSLYNRRKIKELLQNEIERVKRHITLLSIIILDIDHFKSVNDTYGHNKGDEVLLDIARLLQSSVRSTDMVARWGGEEFLIVSVSSNVKQTAKMAEKLRKKIEEYDFDGPDKITVSAGVAQYNNDATLVDFINRADKALYFAKTTGRNRVETI